MSDSVPTPQEPPTPTWDGAQGEWWLANLERTDATLAPYSQDLLSAASIGPGDTVLDVGCGGGATTLAAGALARPGRVVGVDVAGILLERARERAAAAGADNVAFEQGDAQIHAFAPGGADVVMSRFGVMFFADPAAAFANLAGALRPGGRLAFVCWQDMERNDHIGLPLRIAAAHGVVPDEPAGEGPGPWSLSDPASVRATLEGAGLHDVRLDPVERRLRVGADPDDVLGYWLSQPRAKALLAQADPTLAAAITAAIRDHLGSHQTGDGVLLRSSAWVVTATR
jgi:SAM-dependent methyltransferase